MLQRDDFSTRGLLKKMRVKVVCTTDDPLDNLEHHKKLAADPSFTVKILPAFRPDRAMAVDDPAAFNLWVNRLAEICNQEIGDFRTFLDCLAARHTFFHDTGCRLSDHGLEEPYADDYSEATGDGDFRQGAQRHGGNCYGNPRLQIGDAGGIRSS